MKKQKIDYSYYANFWKEYFISKGFKVNYEDVINDDHFISMTGCNPLIKLEIYAGYYRTDTETGGCICADFLKSYNKVSQCPVYFDLNESEKSAWKTIEMLINVNEDFSNKCGRIIKQSGQWQYDPPIYNKKEKGTVNK